MSRPVLHVISLRYSSWSIRALLPLLHAGADVEVKTVTLEMARQGEPEPPMDVETYVRVSSERLAARRALGSVTGYFPVLTVDGEPIHEALAICEWTAERYPDAGLWPRAPMARARARALSAEMASNFVNLRHHMSCHVFARVPGFVPDGPTRVEVARVFELLREALSASGGPFLFGDFGIVDAMYFPVLTRFETYGVALPLELRPYVEAMAGSPAVSGWRQLALQAPAIAVYDDYVRSIGGEVVVPST
jgi:glutathione S-transferase